MCDYNQIETKEDFYIDDTITSLVYNYEDFY